MISFVIVDDDKNYPELISSIITESLFDSEIEYRIRKYYDVESLMKSKVEPDILFLDIEINDTNGIDVAKYYRYNNTKTIVVFITAYEGYIKDSFGTNIFAFVLKSDLIKELPNVLKKLIEEQNRNYYISVNCDREKITVNVKDIITVTYEKRKVFLNTKDSLYELSYSSLKNFYKRLNNDFIFINSKVIVNMNYVKSIANQMVELNITNNCFPISKRKYSEVNNLYNKFLLERGKKWF